MIKKIQSLKSKDIPNIAMLKKGNKRILLVNPKREDAFYSIPHNGLAILGAVLRKKGHEVLIVDYIFLRNENRNVESFIKEFNPDMIGLSVYTNNLKECGETIEKIRTLNPKMPLIVGGPHATLYPDLLEKDLRIDYIVKGEAELTIINLVENAKRETKPKIIETQQMLDLNDLPYPGYDLFYKFKEMNAYPLMTSRGCPNQCIFCAVRPLAFQKWRAKSVESCIQELEYALKTISPTLAIYVLDDNPTVDRVRFKTFLRQYILRIKRPLVIINTRADGIDEEMVYLMKKAGCDTICLGVEHANPQMFESVNKGETLKQIEIASRLVKKYKLNLGLTFIIGLPGDNLQKMKDSLAFAKKLKADIAGVNFIIPYRSTKVREYFDKLGSKYNEMSYLPQPENDFVCSEPLVETKEFSKQDMKKAYYMFILQTAHHRLKIAKLHKILPIVIEHGLYWDFFYWLPRGIIKDLKRFGNLSQTAIRVFKEEGFLKLLKRIKTRNK